MDAIIAALIKAFGPSILVLAVALVVMKALLDSRLKQIEAARAQELKQRAEELKLRLQFDQQVRAKREAAYQLVWSHTRKLPSYPRDEGASRATLKEITEKLRDWYFDGNGMWLSGEAMNAYRRMQEGLIALWQGRALDEKLLPGPDYEQARALCSAFRTELTKDLLSRAEEYFETQTPRAA